jgi:hypothetical protein
MLLKMLDERRLPRLRLPVLPLVATLGNRKKKLIDDGDENDECLKRDRILEAAEGIHKIDAALFRNCFLSFLSFHALPRIGC